MVTVIAAAILVIAILMGIIVALIVRKKKRDEKLEKANYRAFFIMGIIWVPFSIVLMIIAFVLQIPFFMGIPLLAIGLVYLLVGLKKRD